MRRKTPFTAKKLTFCNLTRLLSKAGMVWGYTSPVVKGVGESDCAIKAVLPWSVYNIIILTGLRGLSREIQSRGQDSARACEGTNLDRGIVFPGKPDKLVCVIFIDRPGKYRYL